MRKIKTLFLVTTSVVVLSCSKTKVNTNQLDGEVWKVVNISTVDQSEIVITSLPVRTFTFDKEGGTGTLQEGNLNYNFEWIMEDSYLVIDGEGGNYFHYKVLINGLSKQTWTRSLYVDYYGRFTETVNLEKQ